jgi:hypothetical protein
MWPSSSSSDSSTDWASDSVPALVRVAEHLHAGGALQPAVVSAVVVTVDRAPAAVASGGKRRIGAVLLDVAHAVGETYPVHQSAASSTAVRGVHRLVEVGGVIQRRVRLLIELAAAQRAVCPVGQTRGHQRP